MTRRVYIVNKSGHDFSSARHFGSLVYLTEGEKDPFQVTKMYRQMAAILVDSQRDDYLLVSGLTVMNCIASSVLARKHGIVNWLLYDNRSESYKVRTIDVDSLLRGGIGEEKDNSAS